MGKFERLTNNTETGGWLELPARAALRLTVSGSTHVWSEIFDKVRYCWFTNNYGMPVSDRLDMG